MERKKLYEIEIMRYNISPKQFFSYCRREVARRSNGTVSLDMWIDDYNAWATPIMTSDISNPGEICKIKSFDIHLYLKGTYNFMIEFNFWEENSGVGYLYITEYETETETAETETAETETETETNRNQFEISAKNEKSETETKKNNSKYANGGTQEMKKQTTKKFIMNNYKCYQVGYCDLEDLFHGIDPDYYTSGVYGWNADIYTFGNIAIVTGYRPFGEKINHKTAETFNAAARAAMINNRFDIDAYAGIIRELRRDFIGTIQAEK